jgi:galactokinase
MWIESELIDRSQWGRASRQSVAETIALARGARKLGAVAASAFGAGFGGSVWSLVKADRAVSFKSEWAQEYWSWFPERAKGAEFFCTRAGPSMIEFAVQL